MEPGAQCTVLSACLCLLCLYHVFKPWSASGDLPPLSQVAPAGEAGAVTPGCHHQVELSPRDGRTECPSAFCT